MPLGPWDTRDDGDKSGWHSQSLFPGPRQSQFFSTMAIFQKGNRHLGCVCVHCVCVHVCLHAHAYIHVYTWKSGVNLYTFFPSTTWVLGIDLRSFAWWQAPGPVEPSCLTLDRFFNVCSKDHPILLFYLPVQSHPQWCPSHLHSGFWQAPCCLRVTPFSFIPTGSMCQGDSFAHIFTWL